MLPANLRIVRGDTFSLTLTVTRDGRPLDLTGALGLWLTAKTVVDNALDDAAAVFQKTLSAGIVVTDALGGVARVTIASVDTNTLSPGTTLHFDVQIKTANGDILTVVVGTILIVADVTRTTT